MKFVPMIVALFGFSTVTHAVEITIYRWVDSNNVVHFSQNQPDHNNFTEIPMQKFQHKKIAPKDKIAQASLETDKPDKAALNVKNKEERCITAKNNLATLEKFDLIQYKTDSGEAKLLSAKERKDQLALNKQQVDLFCEH